MTPKQQQLTTLLGSSVTSLDLELWAIEIIGRANRSTLRLVIDHPDRPITVDDCEAVSRQVSRILDIEDPLPERYTLEVSSQGSSAHFTDSSTSSDSLVIRRSSS